MLNYIPIYMYFVDIIRQIEIVKVSIYVGDFNQVRNTIQPKKANNGLSNRLK